MSDNSNHDTPNSIRPVITNVNLFSPNKFIVTIDRFPKINIFLQRINVPDIYLNPVFQMSNREVDIKRPGDKLNYGSLIISFLLDENLETFKELKDWLKRATEEDLSNDEIFSDITIVTLTNNSNKNRTFKFYNCFPSSLSNILVDVSDRTDEPIIVDATFETTHFDLI